MAMVWLRHAEHGGAAQFAEEALPAWRVKGWEPCEAPVDPDPALVEHVPDVPSMPEPEADERAAEETTNNNSPEED